MSLLTIIVWGTVAVVVLAFLRSILAPLFTRSSGPPTGPKTMVLIACIVAVLAMLAFTSGVL